MKIITLSAVLCLAAAAVATEAHPSIVQRDVNSLQKRGGPRAVSRHENQQKESSSHNEHSVEAHNDGKKSSSKEKDDNEEEDDDEDDSDEKDDDGNKKKKSGDDKKDGGDDKKKGGDDDKKKAGDDDKKKGGEGKDAAKKDVKAPAVSKDSKAVVSGKVPNPTTNPNIPRDYASPLWLVQPFGASVWEQNRAYVITWGPNPDPVYAKNLQAKSIVDIRLMRGPPENLREIQTLKKGIDSSVYQFQWTVPATVPPANDYSIRITHEGDVDTYSHYFEIVKAGDPRSSKSNVGEPLELPKKGDTPQPLNKGPIIKPAAPPNPFPAEKPATPAAAPPPNAAKKSANAADSMSPNIMAFALTLFGAVYLL